MPGASSNVSPPSTSTVARPRTTTKTSSSSVSVDDAGRDLPDAADAAAVRRLPDHEVGGARRVRRRVGGRRGPARARAPRWRARTFRWRRGATAACPGTIDSRAMADPHSGPNGWRRETYGRSRDGTELRVFLPAGDGPVAGLLTAAQHGEEPETGLLARRLLERVPADATRWAVVPYLNPDGVVAGTRQNAAGVDLNRNFPASTWSPEPSFTYPPGHRAGAARDGEPHQPLVDRHGTRLGARDAGADGARRAAGAAARGRPAQPARADPGARAGGGRRPRSSPARPTSTCTPSSRAARPGPSTTGSIERGTPALVYEVEHAGLPDPLRAPPARPASAAVGRLTAPAVCPRPIAWVQSLGVADGDPAGRAQQRAARRLRHGRLLRRDVPAVERRRAARRARTTRGSRPSSPPWTRASCDARPSSRRARSCTAASPSPSTTTTARVRSGSCPSTPSRGSSRPRSGRSSRRA